MDNVQELQSDYDQSTRRPSQSQLAGAKAVRPPTYHSAMRNLVGAQQGVGQQQAKFEELANSYQRAKMASQEHQTSTGSLHNQPDFYEALSTDPTPRQVRLEALYGQQENNNYHNHRPLSVQEARRLQSGRRNRTSQLEEESGKRQPIEQPPESVDLIDDIHTTRSSLANQAQVDSSQTAQSDQLASSNPYAIPGLTMSQLSQLLRNANNLESSAPVMDAEDMMTSYSRTPTNSSVSDALMRDYNFNSSQHQQEPQSSSQQQQLISNAMLANVLAAQSAEQLSSANDPYSGQQQHQLASNSPSLHQRLSGSSSISALLGDILRMTRPQQLINSLSNSEQSSQSRPQASILQQLRSLPGPLISLLQGSASTDSSHDLSPVSHDASESSQHYHRVSMSPTDIHSILERSLRPASALPAFPAPKGTPQVWIPPTSGGSSAFQASHNANADFVASNSAGFLRVNQPQAAASQTEPNTYKLKSSADNYQRSTLVGDSQQVSEQATGQQQHAQASQQQQQQNMYPAQPAENPNPNWVQTNDQSLADLRESNKRPAAELGLENSRKMSKPISTLLASQPEMMHNMQQAHEQSMMSQQYGNMQSLNHQSSSFSQPPQSYSNQRHPNELPIPLGYNSMSQQQQSSNSRAAQFELNQPMGVESAPKMGVASPSHNSATGKHITMAVINAQQQMPRQRQHGSHETGQQLASGNLLSRKRRSISHHYEKAANSSRFRDDEEDEEEDAETRPISVVRIDGRPTNSGRVRGYLPSDEANYGDDTDDKNAAQGLESSKHSMKVSSAKQLRHFQSPDFKYSTRADQNRRAQQDARAKFESRNSPRLKSLDGDNALEGAGSGMMSRLLGTASTSDELEEELDDDEDPNDKRKEELEDAEFGIVNDERQVKANEIARPASVGDSESKLGSGSTDNEAYARRHQQRSDIDFYGHPGEGTRTLKYGILGSGNYEVVNGGIYPEADESTAAVNSVANYVRKPGALLFGLPKLLAENSHEQSPQTSFLPGSRLGGFMRGASAIPGSELNKDIGSPLLELIDANVGQPLFDPNMLAQLGGSGSSTRSTHASRDPIESPHKHQPKKGKKNKNGELDDNLLEANKSVMKGSRSQGTNQFNSYQLLPSKKVTIFSDQDLDSAPSEQQMVQTDRYSP